MDIEDLHICKKTGQDCCKQSCLDKDWCFVSDDEVTNEMMKFVLKDGRRWYTACTIQDIFYVFTAEGTDSYMLAAGNTAKGNNIFKW